MKKIRWIRVVANALSGFFIGLGSVITASYLLDLKCSIVKIMVTAVIVAIIQAGIAFSQELKKEVERQCGDGSNPHDKTLILLF